MNKTNSQKSEYFYNCIDNEEYEELLDLIADDIVNERPYGHPKLEGKKEFERFYKSERPFEDVSHQIFQSISENDRVAIRGVFEGRHVGSGDVMSFPFADFHLYNENGKISERRTFFSHGDM